MTDKNTQINTRIENLEKVMHSIEKSKGAARPIDALKPIKTQLSKLGFTISPEDRKTKVFSVDYEPQKIESLEMKNGKARKVSKNEYYAPATILGVLRVYREAIKDSGAKHNTLNGRNCTVTAFKAKYSNRIVELGKKEYLDALNPSDDMKCIRKALIELKRELKGENDVLAGMRSIKVESQAYYWITACVSKVQAIENEVRKERKLTAKNQSMQINPDFVLDTAKRILDSMNECSDWRFLAIALMAVTGRRTSEIIKTAKFTVVTENSVMFSGQLKQKNRNVYGWNNKEFEIPTLVDSQQVVKGLVKLRKMLKSDERTAKVKYQLADGRWTAADLFDEKLRFDTRHTEAVSKTLARYVSGMTEQVFDNGAMRSYWLRAAYTEIAFFELGLAKKNELVEAFRERVLGHEDDKSQASYAKFALSRDVDRFEVVQVGGDECEPNAKVIDVLRNAQGVGAQYSRAKAAHALIEIALSKALSGQVTNLDDVGMTWARSQILDGKKVGAASARKYVDILREAKS